MKKRLLILASACVLVLTVFAGQAAAGGLKVSIRGSGAKPHGGDNWTLSVTARDGGRPATGALKVDVMMGSSVVAKLSGTKLRHGAWKTSQKWPKLAAGQTLTFRATVTSGGRSARATYTVHVQK